MRFGKKRKVYKLQSGLPLCVYFGCLLDLSLVVVGIRCIQAHMRHIKNKEEGQLKITFTSQFWSKLCRAQSAHGDVTCSIFWPGKMKKLDLHGKKSNCIIAKNKAANLAAQKWPEWKTVKQKLVGMKLVWEQINEQWTEDGDVRLLPRVPLQGLILVQFMIKYIFTLRKRETLGSTL